MGRPSGSRAGQARVAVLGAAGREGAPIRQELAELGLPGQRVDLFGATHGEAVLSEYAGEARLIQEPDVGEIVGHEVVVLCETGRAAGEVLSAAGPDTLVIDMVGGGGGYANVPLVHMDLNPHAVKDTVGVVAIPHALSAVVADLLHPLDRAFGVVRATAVVLRPAVDFGEEGIEELREQTIRLLNFGQVPVETFGRQLCFNVIPFRLTEREREDVPARVVREVRKLMGWPEDRLAVRLVTVPVFHGHSILLSLQFGEAPSVEDVVSAYREVDGVQASTEHGAHTPLDAAETRKTVVSDVAIDGVGGYWMWAIAGEAESIPARHAVRVAAALRVL